MSGESPTAPDVGVFSRRVPAGDGRERLVCDACGFVLYENPKVVVGAVCALDDRILLCRRAIPPRRGFWTIPAGYLELNESTDQGAARETREEARAEIEIETLLAVYNVPRISQVQVIYAARLLSSEVSPGPESLAVDLVPWERIPWDEIAFPSVHWALRHHREYRRGGSFATRANPPGEWGDY